jgi:hypothetical protein
VQLQYCANLNISVVFNALGVLALIGELPQQKPVMLGHATL